MDQSTISSIMICLLRNGADSTKDDVIFIRPLDTNCFRVRYQDKSSKKLYEFTDTWEEVSAYLAQIFAVLPYDDDPYKSVQFTLPAYPTILVNIQKLHNDEFMSKMWCMIESVAKGWPLTLKD